MGFKKNNFFKPLASILILTCLVFGFQNCSEAFQAATNVNASLTASPSLLEPAQACGLTPDQGTQTETMYLAESGVTCDGIERSRTCSDGVFSDWTGSESYNFESCTIDGSENLSCGNTPYQGFESRTFYPRASVPYGESCGTGIVQRRLCGDNGFEDWDGNLTFESCIVEPQETNICRGRSPLQNQLKDLGSIIDHDQVAQNYGDPEARFSSCPALALPYNTFSPPARATAAFRTYMENWQAYVRQTARVADQYLVLIDESSKQTAANCVLDRLHQVSQRNIFAEPINSYTDNQGEFERSWVLSALNVAYNKISKQPNLENQQNDNVRSWLNLSSQRVVAKARERAADPVRHNSALYWFGVSIMNSAINLNDTTRFNTGLEYIRLGLNQVAQNGTLPLEMASGNNAFINHLYALNSLIFAAEVARLNNIDLYTYNNSAIDRMVELTIASYADFSIFENLSNNSQSFNPEMNPLSNWKTYWMEIIFARTGDIRLAPYVTQFRPNNPWELGKISISHGLPCLE